MVELIYTFGYALFAIFIACLIAGYIDIGKAVYIAFIDVRPKVPQVLAIITAIVWPLLVVYIAVWCIIYLAVLVVLKLKHKIL